MEKCCVSNSHSGSGTKQNQAIHNIKDSLVIRFSPMGELVL